MKTFIVVALLGLAGYAIFQYRKNPATQSRSAAHTFDPGVAGGSGEYGSESIMPDYDPAGVPTFTGSAAPNYPAQVLAALPTHSTASTKTTAPLSYSPAFGPDENQPGAGQEVFF